MRTCFVVFLLCAWPAQAEIEPRNTDSRQQTETTRDIDRLIGDRLEQWVSTFLSEQRVRDEGFFAPDRIAALREAPRDFLTVMRLWRLVCFERWYALHHLGESDV